MKKRVILLIAIFIMLAIISRFVFISLRPLHHDEGVNYFFAKNLISGYGYSYDPYNYHGPFYFFVLALSFLIFGISEFSLRFPAAVFGIILILLPIFLRFKEDKNFDKYGKYIASSFILISPSLVYYSRYSIHESAFILFSFLTVYFFSLILEKEKLDYLPYFATFLALLFCTKETAILICGVFFVVGLINYKKVVGLGWRKNREILILSLVIFILIFIIFFTSFLSNISGFSNSFKAFLPWTERGFVEKGHDKPFNYFISLLLNYELPIFLFGILGVFFAFKSRSFFYRNTALWFVISFLAYSIIPYKTPWLVVNMTLPLCFLSAIAITGIYEKISLNARRFLIFIIILSVFYLAYFLIFLNFAYPWQSNNQLAYAHTEKEVLELVKTLKDKAMPDSKILVISDNYWPLPFYFNGMNVDYSDSKDMEDCSIYEKNYDFLVTDETIYFDCVSFMKNYGYYSLRPGLGLYLMER